MMTDRFSQRLLRTPALALLGAGFACLSASPGLANGEEPAGEAWIFDGHNDLPWVLRESYGGDLDRIDLGQRGELDTDLPKLREGQVGAQFWSVYVPASFGPFEAMQAQLEQIDLAKRMIARYDDLVLAFGADDIQHARSEGRIASLLGMEGAHSIGNSLGVLRAYHDLGVRYITLTHSLSTDWADSATDAPRHGGLSQFGLEVVREMNRLGILVDLSHVSPEAMHDALNVAEAPVIFSHSSAFALTPHPRNVPDDVLKRVTDNGGVVMVTFIPPFINEDRRAWAKGLEAPLAQITSAEEFEAVLKSYREANGAPPPSTLKDVADHIEHVARVAGVDHVGIGGDFYGAGPDDVSKGLEDVSRYPALLAELRERGWSETDLAKLAHGNVLRAIRKAEEAAERIRSERGASLATMTNPEQ